MHMHPNNKAHIEFRAYVNRPYYDLVRSGAVKKFEIPYSNEQLMRDFREIAVNDSLFIVINPGDLTLLLSHEHRNYQRELERVVFRVDDNGSTEKKVIHFKNRKTRYPED